ncbi:MAG: winged helix-turn-helix transcriptional regulator [Solirubrobacteraceae bacterium]|nr:winged helix-turn-helix transcriptional regulator [Solirubrobacteraceae bacterium]
MATVPRPAQDEALSELELGAWRGMLRVHAALVKALDANLEAAHGLPLTHYDVLVQVANNEGARMRMCDLADGILLSRSGLTRLVDRMAKDGLLERCACEDDARGSFACLTEAGRARLEEARPTHLAAVRTLFLGAFDDSELAQFASLWERVLPQVGAAAGESCCES